MMWELRPLGIIYTCNPSHCFMDLLKELSEKIPVAVINNQNEKMNVDAVELDNLQTGKNHGTPPSGTWPSEGSLYRATSYSQAEAAFKRVEGFLKEYEQAGLRGSR